MNNQKSIFEILQLKTRAKALISQRVRRNGYEGLESKKGEPKKIAEKVAKAIGLEVGIQGNAERYLAQNADLYALDLERGLVLIQHREKDRQSRFPSLTKHYYLAFADAEGKIRGLRIPDGRKLLPAIRKAKKNQSLSRAQSAAAGISAALRSRFSEINERQSENFDLIGGVFFFPMGFRPRPQNTTRPSEVFTVTRKKTHGGYFECVSPEQWGPLAIHVSEAGDMHECRPEGMHTDRPDFYVRDPEVVNAVTSGVEIGSVYLDGVYQVISGIEARTGWTVEMIADMRAEYEEKFLGQIHNVAA